MASVLSPADVQFQQSHIDDDRGPIVTAVSIFLIVVTTLVMVLRFAARKARSLPYGWDDWLAVGGLLFVTLMCTINIISVRYGLGKHLIATDPTQGYKILEAGYFLSLTYAIGHWFIKMSILFLYIRIFTKRVRWFILMIYICMAYISGWSFSLVVTILTQCQPIKYFWEQYNITLEPPATGRCTINSNEAEISTSALNTVADFALLILPISMLWQLQLNLGRKAALVSVFLVGIFACIAGILRLTTTLTAINVNTDATWNTANVYLWTAVEASVGLMCACFPIIGGILSLVNNKLRSVIGRSNDSSGYGTSRGSKHGLWKPTEKTDESNSRSWLKVVVEPVVTDVELARLRSAGTILRTDNFSIASTRV